MKITSINVVAKPEKRSCTQCYSVQRKRRNQRTCCEGHAEGPQQALKVLEIAEVAVNVAENVARLLQLHDGRLIRASFGSCLEHDDNVIEMSIKGVCRDLPHSLAAPVAVFQLLVTHTIFVHMARIPALVSS